MIIWLRWTFIGMVLSFQR